MTTYIQTLNQTGANEFINDLFMRNDFDLSNFEKAPNKMATRRKRFMVKWVQRLRQRRYL